MILMSIVRGNPSFGVPSGADRRRPAASKKPLVRRFATRRDVDAFLAARDFRAVRDGWSNGCWFATVKPQKNAFVLALQFDARTHRD